MAGRHGNKGVISRILPEEDMPYLQDGSPVDVVLNPLGVPSRMNVGQILEIHLGWGAYELGRHLNRMLEEKLLRAIFGEKAGDVRDSSLKVPPGVAGIVINARVFSRKGTEKDDRARDIEDQERARIERTRDEEIKILRDSFYRRVREILIGKETTGKLVDDKGKVLLQKGAPVTDEQLTEIPRKYWGEIPVEEAEQVQQILRDLEDLVRTREEHFRDKIERLSKGDELPPGVIKMVKVYIAIKRKLQVGDKMAGRHGNKGVISRILPEEDMPYTQDGRPVDIVLNPLGVPSRMNVGQILETHLGWGALAQGWQFQNMLDAAQKTTDAQIKEHILKIFDGDKDMTKFLSKLTGDEARQVAQRLKKGVHYASPVFDGAPESAIKDALTIAGLPTSGQAVLFDGRSGEAFDQEVTVGVMYVLKLHHLVDDKIHARSIGPYSLVTQQPLGGKAQFGGQRLGEMEVWAMEAYGTAYALQEFLTVKSDDVMGRTRMYEAIVKGEYTLEPGLPESFNVLIKELQALCLNIELLEPGQLRASDQAAEE
jgi:DNA-directed RNA polymerase subunit beta